MLKSLRIKNIALISECEIEFDSGLNVLSGETGAGKSVILDSIDFVLGQKADKDLITHGERECSVSCVFDVSESSGVREAMRELELEADDTLIIKRTFSDSGKGSIRVNGEPVTATMLRKITGRLVDVHGQSDHFALLDEKAQRALVDQIEFSSISEIKSQISEIITEIETVRDGLKKIGGSDEERLQRLDYLEYAINEIENAKLQPNEEEELVVKRKKFQNLEKINAALSTAHEALAGDNGALDGLGVAARQLSALSAYGDEYEETSDAIEGCISTVQELIAQISDGLDEEFDVAQADAVERRLEEIYSLKSKYGKDYDEITAALDRFQKERDLISRSSEMAIELKSKEDGLFEKLIAMYKRLTELRRKAADRLVGELTLRLRELAMKNAQFSVNFESNYETRVLSREGADNVSFAFSANAGEPMKPLSKVISGGELSRLMLAIKSVTGGLNEVETYIFDEIDAGISGVTASVVAENFARIARSKQIIAISHLPQIVAMSDRSMLIEKHETENKTRTTVREVSGADKVREVVRLVGGSDSSAAALEHAGELVARAEAFKSSL